MDKIFLGLSNKAFINNERHGRKKNLLERNEVYSHILRTGNHTFFFNVKKTRIKRSLPNHHR
ncbi:MAG: DUF3276 family protein [Flavobacteriales bacterium AspAUS03]